MKMVKFSLPGTRMEPGKPDQQSLDTFKCKHNDYFDEVKSVKTPHWFWSPLVQTATQWRGGHVQHLSQKENPQLCLHINSKHVRCTLFLIKPLRKEQPQDYRLVML